MPLWRREHLRPELDEAPQHPVGCFRIEFHEDIQRLCRAGHGQRRFGLLDELQKD